MREARCESIGQHKHGIRFVDDDGRCLACSVEVLRRERDEARETAQRLNRRTQEAEAALADLRKCVEAVNGGKPWCGGSLGRAFLAWDNTQLRDRIAALESRIAALVEAVEIARRKLVEERDIYIDSNRVRGDRERELSVDEAADVANFNQVIAIIDAALARAEAAVKGK